MRLREQLIILTGLTFMAVMVVLYISLNSLMLKGFEELEEKDTIIDLGRAANALKTKLNELDRIASDWSAWDDTYRFMSDRNQTFIDSNLPDKAIANLDISLMLFLDSEGKNFHSKAVDLENVKEIRLPEGLFEQITTSSKLLKFKELSDSNQTIVMLKDQALLLAARQVITSSFAGPPRGYVVIGRFLDKSLLAKLANVTHLNISTTPVPGGFSAPTAGKVVRYGRENVSGQTVMNDMNGKPAFLLRIDAPRTAYQQGLATSRTTSAALLACSLAFLAAILLYAEFAIVRRLEAMSRKTDQIAGTPGSKERMLLQGSTELQTLGSSINRMLDSLDASTVLIRDNEEKFRTVLHQSSDAIFMLDPVSLIILHPNPAFFTVTGYTPDDLPDLTLDMIVTDRESLNRNIATALDKGEIRIEDRKYLRKDGSEIEVEVSANAIVIAERKVLSLVVRDVTERNRENRKVRELAITDMLTGIPNRRHLMQRAVQEFERIRRARFKGMVSASLGCIMIDLDHFKQINDTGGHQCGDEVLRQCSARIAGSVRPYDIIGRYGGEEFAVFLADTDREQTMVVANRIWSSIRNTPVTFGELTFAVTASLGMSSLEPGDNHLDDLLKRADDKLYAAKHNGRDRIEEG